MEHMSIVSVSGPLPGTGLCVHGMENGVEQRRGRGVPSRLEHGPRLERPGAQNGVYYVEVDVEGGGRRADALARGRLGADSAEARSRRAPRKTPRKTQ